MDAFFASFWHTRAMKSGLSSSARLVAFLFLLSLPDPLSQATDVKWQHATSKNGDLPVPGESTQQTGNLIVDLDCAISDGVILNLPEGLS